MLRGSDHAQSAVIEDPQDIKTTLTEIFQGFEVLCASLESFDSKHLALNNCAFFIHIFAKTESLAFIDELSAAIKRSKLESIDLAYTTLNLIPASALRTLLNAILTSTVTKLSIRGNNFLMPDQLQVLKEFIQNASQLRELDIRSTNIFYNKCEGEFVTALKTNTSITHLYCDNPSAELEVYLVRNRKLAQFREVYQALCNKNLTLSGTKQSIGAEDNNARTAFISALVHCCDKGKFIDVDEENQALIDGLLLDAAGILQSMHLLTPNERVALLQFVFMKHIQENPCENSSIFATFLSEFKPNYIKDISKYLNSTLPTIREIPNAQTQQDLNKTWQTFQSNAPQLGEPLNNLMSAIAKYALNHPPVVLVVNKKI